MSECTHPVHERIDERTHKKMKVITCPECGKSYWGHEARERANWIGAPEFFHLNQLCVILNHAFDSMSYLVGSSMEKRDYRDVDIRCMMEDEQFDKLFPGMGGNPQHHALWSLMCSSISEWLAKRSGLPVDFQIQRRTDANRDYGHRPRSAIGMFYTTGGFPPKEKGSF